MRLLLARLWIFKKVDVGDKSSLHMNQNESAGGFWLN